MLGLSMDPREVSGESDMTFWYSSDLVVDAELRKRCGPRGPSTGWGSTTNWNGVWFRLLEVGVCTSSYDDRVVILGWPD